MLEQTRLIVQVEKNHNRQQEIKLVIKQVEETGNQTNTGGENQTNTGGENQTTTEPPVTGNNSTSNETAPQPLQKKMIMQQVEHLLTTKHQTFLQG